MLKVANAGGNIVIEISEREIEQYKRAGYELLKEPVAIPAHEAVQELPPEKADKPVKVVAPVKKVKKVVKHA